MTMGQIGSWPHELTILVGGLVIMGVSGIGGAASVIYFGLWIGVPLVILIAIIGQWALLKFFDVTDGC